MVPFKMLFVPFVFSMACVPLSHKEKTQDTGDIGEAIPAEDSPMDTDSSVDTEVQDDTVLEDTGEEIDTDPTEAIPCQAEEEPRQDPSFCYVDGDGDGWGDEQLYAGSLAPDCFFFDIWGTSASWSSVSSISIWGNGTVLDGIIESSDVDSTPDGILSNESWTYCPDSSFSFLDFNANLSGASTLEVDIYYSDQESTQWLARAENSWASTELEFNGESFASAEIFYREWLPIQEFFDYTGTDCDDNDPYTYPGAAELDSTTLCLTDADQDGYGQAIRRPCYVLELSDQNWLQWNGNRIEVNENGTLVASYFPNPSYPDDTEIFLHCAADSTTTIDFVFSAVSGSGPQGYFGDTSIRLFHQTSQGNIPIGQGYGSGESSFFFQGNPISNGVSFYSESAPFAQGVSINGGSDIDDSDPTVH